VRVDSLDAIFALQHLHGLTQRLWHEWSSRMFIADETIRRKISQNVLTR
jgi:hypothetical protein